MRAAYVIQAEMLAREAHREQYRKDGVTPYITHPERLAKFFEEVPDFAATAWLHDVLEDCPTYTTKDLRDAGIPDRVVEAVEVLTRRENEKYHDYLARVKDNDIAIVIKMRDMIDNLQDNPTEPKAALYRWGLEYLKPFLFETN